MAFKFKYLFLLVALWSGFFTSAQDLLPFVENFTKSEYSGDNQVWSNCQGKDGAMYFANNHYFLRYDGVKWEKYSLPNKTIIRSVFSNGDKIYSGSYNEFGYWKRENSKMVYYSLSEGKKLFGGGSVNEEIWKIFMFDNLIYFQSFNQLFIFNGKSVTKKNLPSQISYCFPVQGKLYAATVTKGVYEYKNGVFLPKSSWSELNKTIIHGMDVYKDKLYIFTRKNGVFIDESGVLKAWDSPINSRLKEELINTARFVDAHHLAIGTAFSGVYLIDMRNGSFVTINRNNSLKNNSVLSLNLDRENDLWLGMDNGISHIEINSPVRLFNDTSGILGTVYSIALLPDGYLLASNHGLFKYSDGKLDFVEGSQGQVWQIDKVGDKYIIGHNDGTFIYKNGTFSKLNDITGGWKLFYNVFDTNYYQANYSGIVRYADATFSDFTRINNLTKPIRNIAQTHPNELWAVDNYRSLYRVEFTANKSVKQVTNVTAQNGLKNDFYVKLFTFKNELLFYINDVWYKHNPISNRLEPYPYFNSLFKGITHITSVDDNSFLLVKEGLFYLIEYQDKTFRWNLIPRKYYEGKSINEDTHVLRSGSKLLINLDDGFLEYEPRDKSFTQAPKIEGFFDQSPISAETKVNYNQSVRIDVVTPFFGYMKPDFFYRLNETGPYLPLEKGSIYLSNLSYGSQDVQIFVRDGSAYKPVTNYTFDVAKPWYFSFWMILFYLFVIGGILFLYYRWNKVRYIEKIKLKEEELRHQQAIYQLEADAENKLKIQEYEKHILEIQVQTKASEVAGKSLSIAKQSEMIDGIQKLLEKEDDINNLKNNIRKTIKINSLNRKEWETFESNLFKSHEDFIKRLTSNYPSLSSKDIKLCIYLKMSLSSKEIAPLMNISYRGVELHRYRLRKKLGIGKEASLSGFINNI